MIAVVIKRVVEASVMAGLFAGAYQLGFLDELIEINAQNWETVEQLRYAFE